MRIKNMKLNHNEHPDRVSCSWSGCFMPAYHHATMQVRGGGAWHDRLMGLCDRHRGVLKRRVNKG